ncbi:hormone-sensitive lipase-like isoform X2 [Lutzomyia longipalpis]|nr:hormone-sensitive lipase-like isoform X2 [Lutzomyia longipalpis]
MSFKTSDLDNSGADGENDLISLVDENSIASQDTLNTSDENIRYTSVKTENGLITYRLVSLGESESNLQSTVTTAAVNTSNMSQPCQVYVIGSPSNIFQTQRNTPAKSEVVVSPVIQHSNVRKRDERRRATHNEVERRRRDKINNWILKLSKIIPPDPTEVPRSGCGNLEGQSKGGILAKACEYIIELKEANSRSTSNTRRAPMFDALKDLCVNNINFFKHDDSEMGLRLHGAFLALVDHIDKARPLVDQISEFAHEYDFDINTPGNGYRSFIKVIDCCIMHSIKTCRTVLEGRTSILFRKTLYTKEIEACSHLLASLCILLDHLMILRTWSSEGSLFSDHTAEELLSHGGAINQYCFYGRCLGFQFHESIRGALKVVLSCMAGFSEGYYSQGNRLSKTTSSMWTSGKFLLDPELRARRVVNLSQNSDVHFCKAFWFLAESEIMYSVPSVIGTAIKVNKVVRIPPETLKLLKSAGDGFVEIPIPLSHLGPGPVTARLLSYNFRQGMMGERSHRCSSALPPSKGLIIHCHGGGFVAQSSKSHELYLRDWAYTLNVPILSIDYSLAPAAPFPRALEEVFYAYCWALNNCEYLGTTGEKIILAGDSAGANLNLSCTLKCIEFGIRKPDGVLLMYCPVLVSFVVSPARLLCLMDPLLPFSFMMSCLKAYTCPNEEDNGKIERNRRRVTQLLNISKCTSPIETSSSVTITPKESKIVNMQKTSDSDSTNRMDATVMAHNGIETSKIVTNSDDQISDLSLDASSWDKLSETDLQNTSAPFKSPMSDTLSDTMASASLRSHTVENTEVPSPDESNGISFEEDSQPITIHKPSQNGYEHEFTEKFNADVTNVVKKSQSSHHYVNNFIERYTLDKENEEVNRIECVSRTISEDNIIFEVGKDTLSVDFLREGHASPSGKRNFDSLQAKSPSEEFIFQVPKDPYISPYFATDSVLKEMPPIKIITLEMDPCLDDCVMFAKRLKTIGNPVELDILEGLPHGFLNFTALSKDAAQGSKLCIKRIAELMDMKVPVDKTKSCC